MKRLLVISGILTTFLLSLTSLAQTPQAQKDREKAKLAELQNKSLVASKDERLQYNDFLKSKNTGLRYRF